MSRRLKNKNIFRMSSEATMEQAHTPDIKLDHSRKKNIFQIASESTTEQELQMSNDVSN